MHKEPASASHRSRSEHDADPLPPSPGLSERSVRGRRAALQEFGTTKEHAREAIRIARQAMASTHASLGLSRPPADDVEFVMQRQVPQPDVVPTDRAGPLWQARNVNGQLLLTPFASPEASDDEDGRSAVASDPRHVAASDRALVRRAEAAIHAARTMRTQPERLVLPSNRAALLHLEHTQVHPQSVRTALVASGVSPAFVDPPSAPSARQLQVTDPSVYDEDASDDDVFGRKFRKRALRMARRLTVKRVPKLASGPQPSIANVVIRREQRPSKKLDALYESEVPSPLQVALRASPRSPRARHRRPAELELAAEETHESVTEALERAAAVLRAHPDSIRALSPSKREELLRVLGGAEVLRGAEEPEQKKPEEEEAEHPPMVVVDGVPMSMAAARLMRREQQRLHRREVTSEGRRGPPQARGDEWGETRASTGER
jgi:hypothetical protein